VTWHVYPVGDLKPHITDTSKGDCWCNPEYDMEHDTYVHNSLDGREFYETGERKLN
jgi:hypothetical protein